MTLHLDMNHPADRELVGSLKPRTRWRRLMRYLNPPLSRTWAELSPQNRRVGLRRSLARHHSDQQQHHRRGDAPRQRWEPSWLHWTGNRW